MCLDMKEKRRPSPPLWRRVLKHFLLFIVLLALGACLCISPFVLFAGELLIHSPPFQRTLDSFRHRNHVPVLVPKTSELIAFVCKGDADSYGNSLYTIRPDGGRLRDISVDKSRIHYHLDWSPDGRVACLNIRLPQTWRRSWTNGIRSAPMTRSIVYVTTVR